MKVRFTSFRQTNCTRKVKARENASVSDGAIEEFSSGFDSCLRHQVERGRPMWIFELSRMHDCIACVQQLFAAG